MVDKFAETIIIFLLSYNLYLKLSNILTEKYNLQIIYNTEINKLRNLKMKPSSNRIVFDDKKFNKNKCYQIKQTQQKNKQFSQNKKLKGQQILKKLKVDSLNQQQINDQLVGTSQLCYFQQECSGCFESFRIIDFVKMAHCSHQTCKKCAKNHSMQCINRNKIICCFYGCGAQYDPESKILQNLQQKYQNLYKRGNFIRYTDSQGLKRCPQQKCQFGVLFEVYENTLMCSACEKRYCQKCLWPEHTGQCNQAADKFIDLGLLFATCPGCNRKIQRNQGCNHMSCVCCYQFCYLCLNRWSHDHICPNYNQRKIRIDIVQQANGRMTESAIQQRIQVNLLRAQNQRRLIQIRERQAQQRAQQRRRRLQMQRQQQARQRQLRLQQQERRRLLQLKENERRRKIIMEEKQKQLQMQRQRGLLIMMQYKAKKKGKWRMDDDQLDLKIQQKHTRYPKESNNIQDLQVKTQKIIESPSQNVGLNKTKVLRSKQQLSNIENTQQNKNKQNQHKNMKDTSQMSINYIFDSQQSNQLKYKQMKCNKEGIAIERIKQIEKQKEKQNQIRLQKIRKRMQNQQIKRIKQFSNQKIRQQRKNQRVRRSNNRFLEGHRIF